MKTLNKVLMLVENNGYPRDFRVRREAEALRDQGYQVSVVCPREGVEPWRECVDDVEIYRFPAPPSGRGVVAYSVEFGYATITMLLLSLWIALRRGVDVVHAANPPDSLFVVGAVFRLLRKRFVFDHHDLAPEVYLSRFRHPRRNLIYRVLKLMERATYAVADVVIATNESYAARARTQGKKAADRVFVVRNGPPLSYVPLPPPEELTRRARYIIGYVGTIGPQDGLDYWIRAIHHLVEKLGRRDFLAVIIGDGDALPNVQSLAKVLGVDSHVLFTGRLSPIESRRYLSATTLCVQPDPLSPLNDLSTMNKTMEYMALGKPTVAFNLKETRVSAEGAALYVTPNDTLEFAERVSWLLDNPAERERMGAIGRTRVEERLAWEYSIPELLRAYEEGLRPRRASRIRAASYPGTIQSRPKSAAQPERL